MRFIITGLILFSLLVLAQLLYIKKLNREAVTSQRIIETLSAGVQSRDRAIIRLQSDTDEREQQGRKLRESLNIAGQHARDREYEIQRLINENQMLRDWSATDLPGDIIRLQQRPAFTAPGDYLRWLSSRQQLPNPRQSAKN